MQPDTTQTARIMSLKAQILTQLKEYVKGKAINLSNVRINTLADRLDTKVDKEDDIKEAIENMDALVDFKELASLDDAKRQKDKKDAEDADKSDKTDKTDDKADDKSKDADKPDKDEAPAWFKQHVENQNKVIESLQKELSSFKSGEVGKTRRQQLESSLEKASPLVKKAIIAAFDRASFATDEEFTEYLAEVQQTVTEDVQAQSDAGLGGDAPAKILGGGGKLKDDEVSPTVKAILDARDKEAAPAAAQQSA